MTETHVKSFRKAKLREQRRKEIKRGEGCFLFCLFSIYLLPPVTNIVLCPSYFFPAAKSIHMLKNYFKIALRNLWKNKGFSAINIIGLGVGIATCLLILLYVLDELSYDRYNVHADRVYRFDNEMKFGDNYVDLAISGASAGPVLAKEFPQIACYTRFRNQGGFLVRKGEENFKENKVIYADSTLFKVFTLPMVAGDANKALTAPNSIVITESIAKKYFNNENALGKSLFINNRTNYQITGIIKDIPAQSHFNFDFFVAMPGLSESRNETWTSQNFNTYFLLKPGMDAKQLEKQLNAALRAHAGPELKSIVNQDMDAFEKGGGFLRASLFPLTKIHLHANKIGELSANGSIQYVYIFSAIAILILLIACVNFMNLSTARSSNRSKEVGIRKVLGSQRKNLIRQFLAESVLTGFVSLLLALLMVWLLVPFFNQLSEKNISASVLLKPYMMASALSLTLGVGLLAGSYPAFFLSAFNPVMVLKGSLVKGFKNSWLRNGLVVFQFTVSIILIAGTIIIYNQVEYMRNKNIGFKKEQVLVLQNTDALRNHAAAFKNELLQVPGVVNTTMTGFLPVNGSRSSDVFFSDISLDLKRSVSMQKWSVDADYIPTLQIQLAAGRNFSPQLTSDSNAIIINEAAARFLGGQQLLNKNIYEIDDLKTKKILTFNIIGIIKNFNFNSLREEVIPMALLLKRDRGSIALRISTNNVPGLLSMVKDKWKSIAPSQPFDYSFMDADYNNLYKAEQRTGKISLTFSVLAIIIACFGLLGLVTYAAEQRTREIGIRKILGASIGSIAGLLSKDFLKMVVIAVIIALPLSWWMMDQWLQDFAYRIHISVWVFVLTVLLLMMIVLITIALQVAKAALANPVKSLKD